MNTADRVLQELQSYKLKKEGRNQYRCNSPFRANANSHSFILKIEDGEHGAYYDHVSSESGSLYDLAKHLGVALPEKVDGRLPVASTKRVYENLKDYARAHGVSEFVLSSIWGWQEVTCKGRPALQFPTKTGQRYRFLDGNQPVYISQNGYKKCWFGLNSSIASAAAGGEDMVICNGEISVIAGQYQKVNAICITSGEQAIPDNLLNELTEQVSPLTYKGTFFVALDCDSKGQRVGVEIAQQLKDAGYTVRAVDLGLTDGGDLADFCMLHQRDSFEALRKCADLKGSQSNTSTTQRKKWEIMHATKLKELPQISWIIPGVIPDRSITVLFGPSGSGKSFLALDYALQIAQHHPVMYVIYEGEYGYWQRIAAWSKHNMQGVGQLFVCIGSLALMETHDFEQFIMANKDIKPKLVIIDTVARAMLGADENSSRDMGLFTEACEHMKRELDCAVMVVHHTNKGGISERGSGALRGAADAMIKQVMEDDLIIVESSKTKDAEPFPTRYLKFLKIPVEIEGETKEVPVLKEADKVIQTDADQLTSNQQKVLKALCLEVFDDGAPLSDLTETIPELGKGQILRVMSRLLKLGFVEQPAKRAPYTITDKGLVAIGEKTRKTHKTRYSADEQSESTAEMSQENNKNTESSESSESLQTTQPALIAMGSIPEARVVSHYERQDAP